MTNHADQFSESHEEAMALLPWLINGTLDPAERHRVQAHVDNCLLCRRQLNQEQRLAKLVERSPLLRLSSQQGFDALASRLGSRRDGPPAGVRLAALFRTWRDMRRDRPWHIGAAVAGSIAIAVIAGILWSSPAVRPVPEPYRTLSSGENVASPTLDVVPGAGLPDGEIAEIAAMVDGHIVAGPLQSGVYVIALPDDSSLPDIAVLLERLRADPRVRFASRSVAR